MSKKNQLREMQKPKDNDKRNEILKFCFGILSKIIIAIFLVIIFCKAFF